MISSLYTFLQIIKTLNELFIYFFADMKIKIFAINADKFRFTNIFTYINLKLNNKRNQIGTYV